VALLPSFVIYMVSMVGETNRAPFDLPEAESELVGGFHTEYSSMKFALFFLAEYTNMVIVSTFATTLFLGGYMAPWPISLINDNYFNSGWWPILWFFGKTLLFLFLFIWLRGTLPRLRYDQFMKIGWKILVPANLTWIVLIAGLRAFRAEGGLTTQQILVVGGIVLLILIGVSLLLPDREVRDEDQEAVPVTGGGYPVPPLDLQVPDKTARKKTVRPRPKRRAAAGVTAGSSEEKE
jgi:NADH-quinone oxidoreductase subunit H